MSPSIKITNARSSENSQFLEFILQIDSSTCKITYKVIHHTIVCHNKRPENNQNDSHRRLNKSQHNYTKKYRASVKKNEKSIYASRKITLREKRRLMTVYAVFSSVKGDKGI